MGRLSDGSKLSFRGDEFIFVELGESIALSDALRVQLITAEISGRVLGGIVDVCPAHASYMIRVNPTLLDPRDLVGVLRDVHQQFADGGSAALKQTSSRSRSFTTTDGRPKF